MESESNEAPSRGVDEGPLYGTGVVTGLGSRGKRSTFPKTAGPTRNSSEPMPPSKGGLRIMANALSLAKHSRPTLTDGIVSTPRHQKPHGKEQHSSFLATKNR
ncbi:hypothetical protein Nepgr_019603 [Nepenthes gracilis]|uniref:Uncharacterized protein n=1 Tax=Nepenthes gracilis TaxID=150966 RepID=A0AAD3SWE1_NEPGR|nr:hypothetical protein Nepgr_019603 [Nepenthes gracilis]